MPLAEFGAYAGGKEAVKVAPARCILEASAADLFNLDALLYCKIFWCLFAFGRETRGTCAQAHDKELLERRAQLGGVSKP